MRLALLPIATMFLLVPACDDGDGGGPVLTADEKAYCDLYEAACERQVDCDVVVISQETTVDACADRYECADLLHAAQEAGGRINTDHVATCHEAVESASCQKLANTHLSGVAPECRTVLEGTGEENQACSGGLLNGGCRTGLICDLSEGICPGVCRSPEANACVGLDCPDGQYCDFGTCTPRSQPGESCWPTGDLPWELSCVDGYHCAGHDEGLPTCEPQFAAGAACDFGNLDACVAGYTCIDLICQPTRPIGEPCSTYTDCDFGLTCDFQLAQPVCALPGAEGESCFDFFGACAPGLYCVDGSCSRTMPAPPEPVEDPILAEGARCDGGGICRLGETCRCDDTSTCAAMHCVPGPALGDSCAPATITTEYGSFTAENPLDAYRCREGICDLFAGYLCVEPHAPDEACSFDTPTLTFECMTLVCSQRRCVGFDELVCSATP
jgi:hypothetical protein